MHRTITTHGGQKGAVMSIVIVVNQISFSFLVTRVHTTRRNLVRKLLPAKVEEISVMDDCLRIVGEMALKPPKGIMNRFWIT